MYNIAHVKQTLLKNAILKRKKNDLREHISVNRDSALIYMENEVRTSNTSFIYLKK